MAIGVNQDQDIRVFAIWIDRRELLRGPVNVLGQTIEDGIRTKSSYDLKWLGVGQLFVQPFVPLDVLGFTVEDKIV